MTFPINEAQPRMTIPFTVSYSDLTDEVALAVVDLPVGAVDIVVRGNVITAFNSATSDVLTIDLATDGHAFATTANIASTGAISITPRVTGALSAADQLQLTWNGTGTAPTAGEIDLFVEFSVEGRSGYVVG